MRLLKNNDKLVQFIKKYLSQRQFLLLSSILVGLTAGLAAVLLKTITHYIQSSLTHDFYFEYKDYLYLIFPLTGIILTITYIKYFLKGRFGRGASHILLYISRKSSLLEPETMYSHIITSALTVGFGGSAGLEAPIVVTGAAIGSNFGRMQLISYKDRTLLLACGSAAGIAAVFNAPIAGVMFALEVLISEATISAFIPLIIAAATGALCSKIILQENILLFFSLKYPFNYLNVPYYIALGFLAGFVSLYYAKMYVKIENLFKPLEHRNYLKALTAGLILAILVFFFPPLFGEGYESIKFLATGNVSKLLENSIFAEFSSSQTFIFIFTGAVIFLKVIATSVTLGGGGNGGSFAPSLFVGAFLGYFFASIINSLDVAFLPEENFTLVGMAGILSGVMYAPLTGIFLIAEITGGYELMIPLMIVSASSFLIVRHFEPYSMDAKELAKKGYLIRGNRDKTILTLFNVKEIIEKDFVCVPSTASILQLTDIIAHSKRNIFPVIDNEGGLLGIIVLENIREILFELETFKDLPAVDLMIKPPEIIDMEEEMSFVMKKFDRTGAWNLPVVKDNKYVGFVSKSSIFSKYRSQMLSSYSDE